MGRRSKPTHPYVSILVSKNRQSKTTTLKTDVLMILGEVAKEIDSTKRAAHHSPTLAVDIPFFGISDRIKNKTEQLDEKLNEASQLNLELLNYDSVVPKYKDGVPQNLSVLVSKEFIQELNGKVPDPDAKDFEAFTEILSYRDISFQTSRKIIFPLVQLVEKLYANKSGKSYDLTTKRLMKLGYYRVAGHNEEGDFFIRGLFSSVTIKNATTLADSQVIVTVAEEVYDDLLKQQIVSIYGEQIEQLKGALPIIWHSFFKKNALRRFRQESKVRFVGIGVNLLIRFALINHESQRTCGNLRQILIALKNMNLF